MKKVELLSPAGSYESGIAAIQNGCDAIYLALDRFGARAFANNFNQERLLAMLTYAHAYGVKVYVTLNTLLHDNEMDECLDSVAFLYENNVDALIIQDLGLLYEVRTRYPDFEVHASTQMHVCNEPALQFLHEIGVKRAVLAREVTLEEMVSFSKQPIELEVFVHGALCVAYSGQCLMSSMVGGRSGNRGECAQTCRMPYSLIDYHSNKVYKKPSYLLSLKDLNTLDYVTLLKEANIASFKIEGRMKKSEYVAHITRLYRSKIDNPSYEVSAQEEEQTKFLFHRGFTSGFLMQQKGSALYNPYRPNHIGIQVGEVVGYAQNKAKVKLMYDLQQHDGIRILMDKQDYGFKVNRLYENKKLVNAAKAGSIVEIECHDFVTIGSKVVKTSDPRIEKQIRSFYEGIQRRVKVQVKVQAKVEQPLMMWMSDGQNEICEHSEQNIEAAQNRATTQVEIKKQCAKLNDTIFELNAFDCEMYEDLFIPIKVVNDLRRRVAQKLYEKRSQQCERNLQPFYMNEHEECYHDVCLHVSVLQETQLLALIDHVACVYVKDVTLYEKYKSTNKVYLSSERVQKETYQEVRVISDIGGLAARNNVICDSALNVYNASTLRFLTLLNARSVTFSHELTKEEIRHCLEKYELTYHEKANSEVVVYGRVEVMVSEHCPINACMLDNNKEGCTLCRHTTYALKDKFNNAYPMSNDAQCRMHLYDYKIHDAIDDIEDYIAMGVNTIRLNFTFENEAEIAAILQKVKRYF